MLCQQLDAMNLEYTLHGVGEIELKQKPNSAQMLGIAFS